MSGTNSNPLCFRIIACVEKTRAEKEFKKRKKETKRKILKELVPQRAA